MSTKKDFTSEEWNQIVMAPVYGGMLVIASDVGVLSMFKETAAMMKAYTENEPDAAAHELVSSVIADLKEREENKQKLEMPKTKGEDASAVESDLLGHLQQTAQLLAGKSGAGEAVAYKEWVAGVAVSVAEAGKEGGFLGFGAVRVSDKEKAALEKIRNALQLPANSPQL